MGWNQQNVFTILIVGGGAGSGVFVYSPKPGAGNLVASIAGAAGTDPYGNPFKAGVTSYNPASGVFIEMLAGQLNMGKNTDFGPGNLLASGGIANLTSGLVDGTDTNAAIVLNSAHSAGNPVANPTMVLDWSAAGGQMLTITNLASNPSDAILKLIANSAADRVLGIEVAGDTSLRLLADSNGKLSWTIGSGGVVGTLGITLGGLLITGGLTVNGGLAVGTGAFTSTAGTIGNQSVLTTDTWHSLGTLAGYTVTRDRYRLTNEGKLDLSIEVVGNGAQAGSVTFSNTLPPAYQPVTSHFALPMGTTRVVGAGDVWPRLSVTNAGNVTVINQGANTNTFAFSGSIPIDD